MPDPAEEGDQEMSEQVLERVEAKTLEMRHVQVWFGSHVIASYTAEPDLAATYAHAMSRRYAGLRITNDPIPAADPNAQPLPPRRIWDAVDPH